MKRGELRGKISTKPGLNRYLRVTPGGLLRIDKAKIKTEANLDGKYLLRCSDPHLLGRRHRAGLQAAPGGRTRLAGHEADPRPAPGLSPARRTHPRPRRALLARAAAHPHHRDHAPARPGTTCAATSTGSTPAPSPAPPACSASAPSCTKPQTRPARPARHPRPEEDHRAQPRRAADQRTTPPPSNTRRRRAPRRIPAGQRRNPRTRRSPQLRNAGRWQRRTRGSPYEDANIGALAQSTRGPWVGATENCDLMPEQRSCRLSWRTY